MAAWRPLHLVVLWAAVSRSVASSVDLEGAEIYNGTGPRENFFGYKAYVFQSGTEKGIVVSAPLQNNGTGDIFICNDTSPDCEPVQLPRPALATTEDFIKAFGMTLAVRTKPTLQFTACSPAWSHECDGTPYFNSICYQWDRRGWVSNFTAAFEECTKQQVDLVFLFDGSLSMRDDEFTKNKEFIESIMESMQNTSIQFAAAQFSAQVRTVFTFKDFQEKRAIKKLKDEKHMKSLTNTHKAMRYALKYLFENSTSGRQPKAIKVVVIITDGNPTDNPTTKTEEHIIDIYEKKHIKRFVIAVGNTDLNLDRLRLFASDPKLNNSFHIKDYGGLTGLLGDLQTKIFNMEGSKHDFGQIFENELSQSGMSAVYAEDSLIVGSVGPNNWKGSLYEIEDKMPELEIQDIQMDEYAYMGYAVAVGKKNEIPFYFTGAPRYKHKGQVIVFSKINSNWTVTQRVDSEQTGSYFGGELCAFDIDSDGTTDFLMIGAPLYYQHQIEGRMYVYALTGENKLVKMQNISEPQQGRFSSSIASLRDLNGDGLQDLAVGAPLEDDRRGVVYIYLGNKTMGIRSNYYQRIRAKTLSESLQQFGVTIDGASETDGLTDIAVGAYGQVVLLRSRPVFSVSAHLYFSLPEISIEQLDCTDSNKKPLTMGTLTVCFMMSEQTKSTKDLMRTGLMLEYDLTVDIERPTSRGFLAANDSTLRHIQPRIHLKKPKTCRNYTIYMTRCVMDTFTPVIIKMSFSQADNQQPYGVLNVDSKKEARVKVPFQRSCGDNDTCVADLQMDFNFTSPAMEVFTAQEYLNVNLVLSNEGDDSYNTSLIFQYPKGLSLSKLEDTKPKKRTLTNCPESEDTLDLTICDVSPPMFRSKNSAIFSVSFHIAASLEWSDFITMTITAHSDNGDIGSGTMGSTFKDYPVTKSLPVVFAVGLAVTFWDAPGASTTYMNYSREDKGPNTLNHKYRVANTGRVPLPVTVSFIFPTKPDDNFEVTYSRISHNKGDDTINCTHPDGIITQNCSKTERCMRIECQIPMLERSASVLFTLTVNATLSLSPNEYIFSERRFPRSFKSSAEISYNRTRYIQTGHDQKQLTKLPWAQGKTTAEYIVPIHQPMIICIASFGGLLLLILIIVALYKCGFFERKKFDQDDQVQEDEPPSPEATRLMSEDPPKNGSSPVDDTTTNADLEKTDASCEE
ncbi:hypothetical protein ACEWY4_018215 [Coilia grayii]|uniref:VWFA domain-containing protein n=1 Tax=Coilia grayii TaxID=363190 RepID=A0ABD1JLU3_9TELE